MIDEVFCTDGKQVTYISRSTKDVQPRYVSFHMFEIVFGFVNGKIRPVLIFWSVKFKSPTDDSVHIHTIHIQLQET